MADPIQIITAQQLASYPGVTQTEAEISSIVVDLTNSLVTEAWTNPVDPPPTKVIGIALEVAARVLRNPKGLESWTRSIDTGSRTERLPAEAARAGFFLTAAERATLGGSSRRRLRYGTIRTRLGY